MNRARAILLLLGMLLCHSAPALDAGEIAPEWRLHDPAGREVDYYGDSAGSVSVVLFWATWCPYCRTLMPHLQKVADEYAGRGVRFYALNGWEDADPEAYMRRHGFTFTLLLRAEPAAQAWGVFGTPGLFVLDREHRVIYRRHSGEDDLDVETTVREALASQLNSVPGGR